MSTESNNQHVMVGKSPLKPAVEDDPSIESMHPDRSMPPLPSNLVLGQASVPAIEPKDLFKFVLDTRNFEITNFWQSSNYLLVLNTGIAIAFFSLKDGAVAYAPFVAALGTFVSILWNRVTLGSKFWQVHWENKLADVERILVEQGALDGGLGLFSKKRPT